MLSNLFLKTWRWRFSLMKYSSCTFVKCDKNQNYLSPSTNFYKTLSFFQIMGYMAFMFIVTSYFIIDYLFSDWENGVQDIFDVEYKPRDEAKAALIHAAHAMYLGAFVLFGGVWTRFYTMKTDIIAWTNMSLRCIFDYEEKYKEFFAGNVEVKRNQKISDFLIVSIAILTVTVPFIYGGLLFQSVLPENRVITEVLEIPLEFHWSLLPLSLPIAYSIINATDIIFILDISGVVYFMGWVYWNHLLQPVSVRFANGTPNFTCRLGCVLTQDEMVDFYKIQKMLERSFNKIWGHWLLTIHHGSTILLSTIGLFICVKHTERLLEPGFLMAPLAMILCTVLEYVETIFVVDAHDGSKELLDKWKMLAKFEKSKLKKSLKYLQGFTPIRAELAYPYFVISMENFLEYQKQIMEFLVDLLISNA